MKSVDKIIYVCYSSILFIINLFSWILIESSSVRVREWVADFVHYISLASAKVLRRSTVAYTHDRGQELSIPICGGVSVTRNTCHEDASVEFSLSGFLTAAEFLKFDRCGHLTVYNDYNRVICAVSWVDECGQLSKEKARFFFGGKGPVFLTANEITAVKKSLLEVEEIYLGNLGLGMYPEVNNSLEDSNVLEKIAKTATKPAVVKEAITTP